MQILWESGDIRLIYSFIIRFSISLLIWKRLIFSFIITRILVAINLGLLKNYLKVTCAWIFFAIVQCLSGNRKCKKWRCRFSYLRPNGAIKNIVLPDLDLLLAVHTFETLISRKRTELTQNCRIHGPTFTYFYICYRVLPLRMLYEKPQLTILRSNFSNADISEMVRASSEIRHFQGRNCK